jgi:uncharacterized protein YigE (DUF2233 family)
MKHRSLTAIFLCGLLCLVGCVPATSTQTPSTVTPARFTPVVTINVPTPTPAPTPMTEWQLVEQGIEFLQRREHVGDTDDWVTLVRIDPQAVSLRVHYDPDTPRTVREWLTTLDAAVVINAGFFTPEKRATGLVIADGKRAGQTYKGFGGMFSVRAGMPQLQWLARQPYVADDSITQAVQSFPMLLVNGQIVDGLPDDGSRNRRSFVGIDAAGRVVLGVCHSPLWTMTDLAGYLVNNPMLQLTSAMNLDGGSSSGLWIRGVSEAILLDSIESVPSVIAVER